MDAEHRRQNNRVLRFGQHFLAKSPKQLGLVLGYSILHRPPERDRAAVAAIPIPAAGRGDVICKFEIGRCARGKDATHGGVEIKGGEQYWPDRPAA